MSGGIEAEGRAALPAQAAAKLTQTAGVRNVQVQALVQQDKRHMEIVNVTAPENIVADKDSTRAESDRDAIEREIATRDLARVHLEEARAELTEAGLMCSVTATRAHDARAAAVEAHVEAKAAFRGAAEDAQAFVTAFDAQKRVDESGSPVQDSIRHSIAAAQRAQESLYRSLAAVDHAAYVEGRAADEELAADAAERAYATCHIAVERALVAAGTLICDRAIFLARMPSSKPQTRAWSRS